VAAFVAAGFRDFRVEFAKYFVFFGVFHGNRSHFYEKWARFWRKMSKIVKYHCSLLSTQDAIKVREGLATFSKLSNERMDRFHEVLQTEHDSLQNHYENVKRDQESTTLEFNAIAIMMAELTKFISLHDQLESLALGVDNLVMGQLSPPNYYTATNAHASARY
jgi:hypothetical protein